MIPIIYIHFGSIPEHLLISINQALKFDNKVVLITDMLISILGVEIVNFEKYNNSVSDFEELYEHMSTNSADFEKICIKRWIILSNYVSQNNIPVCYYSDSDVMIFANMNDVYKNYESFDAVYTLPEYQDNFRWTASGCCSFWKSETLQKFSKFIIEAYSDKGKTLLLEKWNYHQVNLVPGGVCDMTLLFLFSKTIRFFSLSKEKNNIAFDQNYIDAENYYKNEFELVYDNIANTKVKKIEWKDKLPYAYNLVEKKTVQFIALTEFARYVNAKSNISLKTTLYRLVKRLQNKGKQFFKKEKPSGWFGNYSSWEDAVRECEGYEAAGILNKVKDSVLKVRNGEAVYERDSVLFDEVQYSVKLIQAFNDSIYMQQLHVVDFGGSLGSTYFQHKNIFKDVKNLKWSVVEQKHFVDCGKKEISIGDLNFFYTIDEALKDQQNQVLLLSSVIPYFKEPYVLISQLLKYKFKFIIIDRTAFIKDADERITKQVVPEFIYKASYPAWFLSEKQFIDAFSYDYELIFDFESAFDSDGILEDGKSVYRKGFYFKLK